MASKQRYSVAQVVDAIRDAHGIKADAARSLGCDWTTVHRYAQRHPTVQDALEEARESLIDKAESGLLNKLEAEEWGAIKFVLTTLGKGRGYVVRHQQEVKGSAGIEIHGIDFGGGGGPIKLKWDDE